LKQEIENPPPGFEKWDRYMKDHKVKVKRGENVGRKPPNLHREVHLPTLDVGYDQNTYHYSDFMPRLE